MLTPGDVVVVLFTYSDMSGAKIRPALVISSQEYITETGMVVLAAISSKPTRNHFEISLSEWKETGLKMPSKVCVGKLMTVNIGLAKKIGHLTEKDMKQVMALTRHLFK